MLPLKTLRPLAFLLLLSAATLPCLAAEDTGNWSNVQAMRAGDRMGVIRADQKRLQGTFSSASESAVMLSQDGQSITVPREEVVRVYRAKGMSRLTRTLIGAGCGLVVGVIADQTLGAYLRNEAGGEGVTAMSIAAGVGAGAGLGAATGNGYQTIYQRSTPLKKTP